MARTYSVVASNVTLTGANTILWVNPAAAGFKELAFTRCEVDQHGSASSSQARIQLVSQPTSFPTVTGVTPRALDASMPASTIASGTGAAGTAGKLATAEGAGTKVVLYDASFNILNGWLWAPDEKEQIILPVGSASGFGVYFPAAPSSLTGWTATLLFEER